MSISDPEDADGSEKKKTDPHHLTQSVTRGLNKMLFLETELVIFKQLSRFNQEEGQVNDRTLLKYTLLTPLYFRYEIEQTLFQLKTIYI